MVAIQGAVSELGDIYRTMAVCGAQVDADDGWWWWWSREETMRDEMSLNYAFDMLL